MTTNHAPITVEEMGRLPEPTDGTTDGAAAEARFRPVEVTRSGERLAAWPE